MTASGMPWASVMRWCLEPGRARSVGFGPVFDRRPRLEWKRNRQCSATSQSGLQGVAVPAAGCASGPRPRLPARPEAVASNSCQNHSPVPWVAFPTECRSGAQTESQPEPHDHSVACVQDTCFGAAWAVAKAGRSAPTTRHRESIYPFPLRRKTEQRLTKLSPCEQGEDFSLLAVLKGEHRIKLFLNQPKEPPWRTTVLFLVHEPMVEIFNEFAEGRYQLESDSEGCKTYLVMDGCQSRKEFIDTMLEAINIMDKAVMASRIGILCDSDERHG